MDFVAWYASHKGISVVIDEHGDWYVLAATDCENLEDNRCGVYEERPMVCAAYSTANCEYDKPAEWEVRLDTFRDAISHGELLFGRRPETPPDLVQIDF